MIYLNLQQAGESRNVFTSGSADDKSNRKCNRYLMDWVLGQHMFFTLRHKMRKPQIARSPDILLGWVEITQVDRRIALIKKLASDFV